jgi:hypothetical protein
MEKREIPFLQKKTAAEYAASIEESAVGASLGCTGLIPRRKLKSNHQSKKEDSRRAWSLDWMQIGRDVSRDRSAKVKRSDRLRSNPGLRI